MGLDIYFDRWRAPRFRHGNAGDASPMSPASLRSDNAALRRQRLDDIAFMMMPAFTVLEPAISP